MSVLDASWREPPSHLTLVDDEVHVWRSSLELSGGQIQNLQRTLAPDEQERAARFHFQKDRNHYVVARGTLRAILSRYLGVKSDRLRFNYSSYGKPALDEEFDGARLQFNLAHSHQLALYALTLNREIGVDLEYVRADFASDEIAERFFSPREAAVLRTVPQDLRTEAFFHCWTRKEALVKAKGQGLSIPLDQFDVSLAPGEPAALLRTLWDPLEAARWSLQALAPGPGYVGALAVAGHSCRLRCWQWPA